MEETIFDLSPKKCKKSYGKKVRKLKKGWIIFAIIFTSVIWILFILHNYISSVIISICSAQVKSYAMSAVNNAVIETMANSIEYSDLIKIEKDGEGNISLIETNSVLVNRLARETALQSESNLEKYCNYSIKIPIGQLSGTPLLANVGPEITIQLQPLNSVNCNFISEFEDAGINQTRHKIYLNVIANVQLILPTFNSTVKTAAEVLVCESLLVGKVPEIYLNMGAFGSNLNLIP